ncbi:MAG: cytochrome c3 family protein [Acidobacteria bacterium]|nr:cytochrome c3 family protein [Acidobacteriota bacterium]
MRSLVLLFGIGAAVYLAAQGTPEPPKQPVPYSHKKHAGELKLDCKFCHENKDPGEIMGIPGTAKCMGCHTSIKKDSPHIAKLAETHTSGRPMPWVRIYQIPSFVFFSHRAHSEAGNTCAECHGPVAERDALRKELSTSMGACMDCHRSKKAPNDCTFCHEARN